jgi:hypothetical protein
VGIISGHGILQEDLVDLLQLMNTNLTGLLAKLDDDGSITATDYEATLAITFPSSEISENGIISQGAVLSFLDNWIASFNAALAKIDADAGANIDNDYATACGITDVINATTNPAKGLYNGGINQGDLVSLLQTCITKFATLTAKLDDDDGVTDTDYAETWDIPDTVDNTGC